jgi:hypothetical protein
MVAIPAFSGSVPIRLYTMPLSLILTSGGLWLWKRRRPSL